MVMTMMMKIIMMMMVEVRLLVLSLLQRPSSNELTSPKAGDILGNWQWHCRVGLFALPTQLEAHRGFLAK